MILTMTSNKDLAPWRCGVDATVNVPIEVYEALQGFADSAEAQVNIIDIWNQAVRKARTTSIVA